jgi:hypothetical protein
MTEEKIVMKQMRNQGILPFDSAELLRLRFEAAKRAAMKHGRERVYAPSPWSYRDGWKLDVDGV